MNGYLLALFVFVVWWAGVYWLAKVKWFDRHSMGTMGPMILLKTTRGRDFIDRLASKRLLWTIYGKLALWICAAAMVLIMTLLIWEATIVSRIPEPPSPELILGIPGVNPVIPLGYGILGLVVAIVVHEFSHGILTRLAQLKVVSMGLVFLVFPVGAFVEPDEKQLQETTRARRSKVYAAGPASNIIIAMLFLGVFSGVMMSSVETTHDGALTLGVVGDSPASFAGIEPTSVVVSVGGDSIQGASDFEDWRASVPGEPVNIDYYFGDELRRAEGVVSGLVVSYAAEDFAAYQAGLRPGMVVLSLADTPICNFSDLSDVMAGLSAGQIVELSAMSHNPSSGLFEVNTTITSVVLSDKYDYYDKYDPDNNDVSYEGRAYLGGGFLNLGISVEESEFYAEILANPFSGDRDLSDFSRSWLRLIALPFLDLAPIASPVSDLYTPSGALGWMPDSAFWIITNCLYWIFWLNLMVGLTNVLPMVPLDGGALFRDLVDYLLGKSKKGYTKEQRDRLVGPITTAFALAVFALILWQLVGPAIW